MSQTTKQKSVSKMAFFLLPLGIAVNFIGGQIATLLNLPIYLDAIGTMVLSLIHISTASTGPRGRGRPSCMSAGASA